MTFNFSIAFQMDGIQYKADVLKIPLINNIPVQYHVDNIVPAIDGVESQLIFVYDPGRDIFEFSYFHEAPRLCGIVLDAIKNYCNENHISLTGN